LFKFQLLCIVDEVVQISTIGRIGVEPLFVTLGAGVDELATQRTVIDGFRFGLAKRSIQIG